MIIWQIILITAVLFLLPLAFFGLWGLFTDRPRPGFWKRINPASYWNLSILAIGLALVSMIIIFALQYRQQERTEERATLQRIAAVQQKIFASQGSYGFRADVLARAPDLYRQEFAIDNGDNSTASYISTPRCQLLLLGPGKQRGPSCGAAK